MTGLQPAAVSSWVQACLFEADTHLLFRMGCTECKTEDLTQATDIWLCRNLRGHDLVCPRYTWQAVGPGQLKLRMPHSSRLFPQNWHGYLGQLPWKKTEKGKGCFWTCVLDCKLQASVCYEQGADDFGGSSSKLAVHRPSLQSISGSARSQPRVQLVDSSAKASTSWSAMKQLESSLLTMSCRVCFEKVAGHTPSCSRV